MTTLYMPVGMDKWRSYGFRERNKRVSYNAVNVLSAGNHTRKLCGAGGNGAGKRVEKSENGCFCHVRFLFVTFL